MEQEKPRRKRKLGRWIAAGLALLIVCLLVAPAFQPPPLRAIAKHGGRRIYGLWAEPDRGIVPTSEFYVFRLDQELIRNEVAKELIGRGWRQDLQLASSGQDLYWAPGNTPRSSMGSGGTGEFYGWGQYLATKDSDVTVYYPPSYQLPEGATCVVAVHSHREPSWLEVQTAALRRRFSR